MKKLVNFISAILVVIAIVNIMPNPAAESVFEMDIAGATGYGVIDLNIRAADSSKSSLVAKISAGQPFVILSEGTSYLQVRLSDGRIGYASKTYTMINLPDVIPSIIYKNSNSESALYRSSEKALPGVTGQAMYDAKSWNDRLGREEYNMACLFDMAKKIAVAQAAALSDGNTLVIYEAYRPYETQVAVKNALAGMMNDSTVKAGIGTKNSGWGESWFISQGVSNHQRGGAIDVSLADAETGVEYAMPTQMHELSKAARTFEKTISSWDKTGWKKLQLSSDFTEGAKLLQGYCTRAGMTPLASEWWHFNDIDALLATGKAGAGNFVLSSNVSEI